MDGKKRHGITVVGVGPGAPQYVLPAALKAMQDAQVLVGGRRILADFARADQETFPITGNIAGVIEFLRERVKTHDVTVAVSGDPGYFSLLDTLRREFSSEILCTVPGISSLQFAFARLNLPWHEATFVSFHGREPDAQKIAFAPNKLMGMLTDGERNSRTVAECLLKFGWADGTPFYILERLSYADEKITRTTLAAAAKNTPVGHCVLIVGDV